MHLDLWFQKPLCPLELFNCILRAHGFTIHMHQTIPDPPCTPWPNSTAWAWIRSKDHSTCGSIVGANVRWKRWLWPDWCDSKFEGYQTPDISLKNQRWDRLQWWIVRWLVVRGPSVWNWETLKTVGDINWGFGILCNFHRLTGYVYIYIYSFTYLDGDLLARATWTGTVDQRRSCGGSSSLKKGCIYIYMYVLFNHPKKIANYRFKMWNKTQTVVGKVTAGTGNIYIYMCVCVCVSSSPKFFTPNPQSVDGPWYGRSCSKIHVVK